MLNDLTANTLLACKVCRADSFWSRFMGLMGKKSFPGEYDCLVFEKCDSIHCFFMRMPIDVIFADKDLRVVRCFHSLKPWRLAFGGLKSCTTLELPAGTLKKCRVKPGDLLQMDE